MGSAEYIGGGSKTELLTQAGIAAAHGELEWLARMIPKYRMYDDVLPYLIHRRDFLQEWLDQHERGEHGR